MTVLGSIFTDTMDLSQLPPPRENQAFCYISALESGFLWLELQFFITTAKPGDELEVPSLSFLLRHSATKQNILFDMGIRKDKENYPQPVKTRFFPAAVEKQAKVPLSVVESLGKGGLQPDDIHHIVISHCHWDHIGDPALFPSSKFVLGGAARTLFEPGYPADPTSFYQKNLFPPDRTDFLPVDNWQKIGPFPKAFDFFGDGSVYIIDAPGHLPGHINLLARTSADGAWVYLAGDSAHHWSLITRESDIAGTPDGFKRFGGCAHEDKELATENIKRIHTLTKVPRVRVILAHDAPWYEDNKGGSSFWPGSIKSL